MTAPRIVSFSSPADAARARFWRSVEEAQGRAADDEPLHAVQGPVSRRDFLKLMSASLALAGSGCSRPPLEKIVPYRDGPAQQTYGKPVFYASALACDGSGVGVLVECNMGRPTKIEGNPSHPGSLGATDVATQAAILELWDPDRSQSVRTGNAIATWGSALAALQERLRSLGTRGGARLRLLTETLISPSLHAQIQALLAAYPGATWHQWEPLNHDNAHEGARLAFGTVLDTVHRFDRARTIVALDADFLDAMPGRVRYAHDFASSRGSGVRADARSRLYAIECAPSLTGANADHRLPLRGSAIAAAAHALARALGLQLPEAASGALPDDWLRAVIADLQAANGASIVVVGERQPPHVHALAHAINERLGNVGRTVLHVPPIALEPVRELDSIASLAEAMRAGDVDTLLILGANPVYSAPAELHFAEALARVPFKLHHGLYLDETGARCDWHVPAAHPLESWGDLASIDGTLALQQPCIAPLYDGKTAHELVAAAAGNAGASARDLVRAHWQSRAGGDLDGFWEDALRRGVVTHSAPAPLDAALQPDLLARVASALRDSAQSVVPAPGSEGVELAFVPDARVGDGRWANNPWLQELPKPLSQLTWDNALEVSPALALRLGLASEDVVELRVGEASVEAPVWVMPGLPDDGVALALGYGRARAGSVGNDRGTNAYALRTRASPWLASAVSIAKRGRRYRLASAQTHARMEGRDIVRLLGVDEAAACTAEECGTPGYRNAPTLYTSPPQAEYAWAMSIDLSACTGCGACTIACQAENNIPVVGKSEVENGREMHWIRVDRYYEGDVANPRTVFQPVPCMQCEHAPCEVVCPTEASVHDAQGINVQVYNRCIGTRFCSNNCPYKVRRFNFLQYSDDVPQHMAQRNPEVTVRMRGVMEKCNYCLQRITTARIAADVEGRRIRDGEVVTACQAVCPTQAIVFGDLNDPASEVNRRKRSPLDYALLVELNTRPRTTYLARVVNAAPALAGQPTHAGGVRAAQARQPAAATSASPADRKGQQDHGR